MLISSGAGFFMWFLQTKVGVIVFEAAFNMVFISGWNALDVLTTEAYPTNLRLGEKQRRTSRIYD